MVFQLFDSASAAWVAPRFVEFKELPGLVKLVQVLLTRGADVRARDQWQDNSTPLHWTAGGGYVKLARALLKYGGDRASRMLSDPRNDPKIGWNNHIERIHAAVAQALLEHTVVQIQM